MSNTLVSVVIPSYNHKRYIGKAIQSVIDQKYRPIELIIIDDGSSDGSGELIWSLRSKIEKSGIAFKFIERENRGAHHTINEGLKLASGEWLTILNSDDYYLPTRITSLLKALADEKGEFAFSDTLHVD